MDETGSGSWYFMCDDGPSAYINSFFGWGVDKTGLFLSKCLAFFVIEWSNFQIILPRSYLRHVSGSYWLRMTSYAWIFLLSAINFKIALTGSHFQVRIGWNWLRILSSSWYFMCDDGPSAYINSFFGWGVDKTGLFLSKCLAFFVITWSNFKIILPRSYLRHVSGSYWLRMTSYAWIFLISAINFQITLTGSHFQVRIGWNWLRSYLNIGIYYRRCWTRLFVNFG